jgi:hypothetical protein
MSILFHMYALGLGLPNLQNTEQGHTSQVLAAATQFSNNLEKARYMKK